MAMTMDEITQTFKQYDKDGNGYISVEEAHKVLNKELGFSAEKTKQLINIYDRNADGRLSYEEFIWFYWKVNEKKDDMQKMFKKFDTDNSLTITFEEARSVLQGFNFSDDEIKKLMTLHDTNKDGVLQYEEFVHFWNDAGSQPKSK